MIDDRRFSRGAIIDEQALKDVTVRRLKAQLTDKDFQPRIIKKLPFTPSEGEQRAFTDLDTLLQASARRNGRRRAGDIVSMLLKKRFLSSRYAFGSTMSLYQDAAAGAGLPDLEDDDEYYSEVLGLESDDEDEGEGHQPEFSALRRSKGSDALVAASAEDIANLARWRYGYEHQPDARLTALIEFLDRSAGPTGAPGPTSGSSSSPNTPPPWPGSWASSCSAATARCSPPSAAPHRRRNGKRLGLGSARTRASSRPRPSSIPCGRCPAIWPDPAR